MDVASLRELTDLAQRFECKAEEINLQRRSHDNGKCAAIIRAVTVMSFASSSVAVLALVRNGPETNQHEADDGERQDSR
jgi:hypothetical protein